MTGGRLLFAAAAVLLLILATGCANTGSGGAIAVAADGSIDYGDVHGTVRIDGSSTVFPITEAVAEEFSKESRVRVNVGFSGTGGGFERFCRGEIDISDASRPIRQNEIDACAEHGIDDIVEFQVAIDALTVVVNQDNDFVDCLTVQQLHDIFTGQADRWSDLDAAWPDDSIVRFFPGTDSGTFDYFVEAVIEGVDENASHTGDGTASEDDNVLAQGVEGDDDAIGYFGFAYFQEAGQGLKPVAIDSGDGCVEPSLENALDGSYKPLSRPLFIYTREQFLRERPELLGLTKFYIDHTNALSEEVGYIPLPDDVLAAQQAKLDAFLPEPGAATAEAASRGRSEAESRRWR
ncbi:MAG TPA: PstS family phosphate ABC transporter substrate-binding protein [Dehalococcoidia bacterium]|nr:PstS family phosphate ABC transporter substrate-binding protein [Dehalococcoidia bacterium]